MDSGGIDQLARALDALGGEGLWQLTDREMTSRLTALGVAFHRLEILIADTTTASDDRRFATSDMGYPDSAALLANTTPLNVNQARQLTRRAARILGLGGFDPRYQPVETAYRDGTLAGPHAEKIATFLAKYRHRIPEEAAEPVVEAVIAFGADPDPKQVDGVIKTFADRFDRDNRIPPASEDHDLDSLHLSRTFNGRWRLDADLGALTGEKLATALDALGRPQTGDSMLTGEYGARTPEQLRADQFDELLRRTLAADILPDKGGLTPRITLTADIAVFTTRPDIIDTLLTAHGGEDEQADLFTDTPDDTQTSGVPRSPTTRHERMTRAVNRFLHNTPTLPWSGVITEDLVRMLACDAGISPVLCVDGKPVALGRDHRTANPRLRHYLNVRDRGCTFPGCRRPASWCDAHHIKEWERDGGATDPDNCLLLCRHHHTLLHRGGWTITMEANETPVFTPPSWVDPFRQPLLANGRTLPAEMARTA